MSLTRHTYEGLTWIDLVRPTREEASQIIETYGVHPVVAEELLENTRKPRIDLYDNHIFLILHFPALRHTHNVDTLQEIDFIIGKKFLITTRYDEIDAIHKFAQVFETNTIVHHEPIGNHAGYLFYFLIKKLYRSLEHELESIESELDEIELRIFEGKERDMVHQLSLRGRDITDFKKALGYHFEVLESLEIAGKTFFGPEFSFHLSRIIGEYKRVNHQLDGEQTYFTELRETNNSLLSTKQNEIMKTLTIIAFIVFPMTLVGTLFGMNTEATPVIGGQYDFWIVIGIMLAFSFCTFLIFKFRRWL